MTNLMALNHIDLIDRLRRFQVDFEADFDYRDIFAELKLINKNDFGWIFAVGLDNAEKIDRLLFYYIYKLKNVRAFLDHIKVSYYWIYQKVITVNTPDKWVNDYRRAICDIPNNQDWNVHRTERLWDIQKNLKELQRGNYLILFGKLGFGKRWLAVDACRDYSVICRMNFKIYWLNVSKCTTLESILDKLHRLKVLLNVDDLDIKYSPYSGNTKNEIIYMRNHLRKVLDSKDYNESLIVLTDVQDENIVKAFDLNCKMLLTTRHMEKLELVIPSQRRKTIDIDSGLTLAESRELFARSLQDPRNEFSESMRDFLAEIHKRCSGHPHLMAIIAKTFQNSKESEYERRRRCENWINKIDNYKLDDDYGPIKMALDESVKFLTKNQKECYHRMVVFSDNVEVPLEVLAKLWETDKQGAEQTVQKLLKYSLIEKQNETTCSLHYVQYKYLKEEVSEESQTRYHRLLLDKYNVEEIYHYRKELDLDFPHDHYFHFYIGYHIRGAKKFDLFEMYLDFGFLEQKIRIAKLPNTLGDLFKFQKEIYGSNKRKMELWNSIWEFLPTIEQLLFKSRHVTLLQYALTSEGLLKDEARRQACKFHDRVWLDDNNHLQSENQIIELQDGSQPKIVRFVRPNERDDLVCLITLNDNNILLHEIAPDYANKPILYESHKQQNTIIDMQIFHHQAFLVLNDLGKLMVYNLKWNRTRRPSAPTNLNINEFSSMRTPFMMENANKMDKFSCFAIIENGHGVDLIIGTTKGNLKFFRWISEASKFQDLKQSVKTNVSDLFRIAYINDYVVMVNKSGDIKFINLVNSGNLGTLVQIEKLESPVSVHQGSVHEVPITICVSSNKVIQIIHEKTRTDSSLQFVMVECEDIFLLNDEFDENKILSSAVSKDFLYIVLGTTKGIYVIDRIQKKIVSRRNVSEQVISLDIYRYPEEKMYLFISVFEDAGQIINLHSFTQTQDKEISMLKYETHYLVGEDLFDIKKLTNDDWNLVAVDNKRCIQHMTSGSNFSETEREFPFNYQVKRICYYNNNDVLVGCTNGEVHKIDSNGDHHMLAQLTGEITYLENFNGTVIVSSNCSYKILGMDDMAGKAVKAYRYDSNTLIVIKKDCSIEFIDLNTKEVLASRALIDEERTCIAQAYSNSKLAIGTVKNNNIYLWDIDNVNDKSYSMKSIENQLSDSITCLAISPDKHTLAVGCQKGKIEVFSIDSLIPIYTLESHNRPVMNLLFSPWLESEGPLILLSVSESINFWNITHVQSNRFKRVDTEFKRTRVSQRFKSPLKIHQENENNLDVPIQNLKLTDTKWSDKKGPSDKPELLSCIKFVGKSAKKVVANDDFTRFVTIDNEGNIYNLKLIDPSNDQQITIDFNGNPSSYFE